MAQNKTYPGHVGPITKEYTVCIDDKDITIISIFEGTETASKLLYDLAVSRILYEKPYTDK